MKYPTSRNFRATPREQQYAVIELVGRGWILEQVSLVCVSLLNPSVQMALYFPYICPSDMAGRLDWDITGQSVLPVQILVDYSFHLFTLQK